MLGNNRFMARVRRATKAEALAQGLSPRTLRSMTDRQLDEFLKAAEAPPRDAAYWDAFPKELQTHLTAQRAAKPIVALRRFEFRLWKLGVAAVGTAVVFL